MLLGSLHIRDANTSIDTKKCTVIRFAENAPSHCGEPNTPDFDDCKPSAENSHDFNTPDMTLSQQAVSTASAQLNAVLVKGNSEKPPSGPPFQNPYARNNTNPYQSTNRKPDNHRNRPYVSSAPNNPYSENTAEK